MTASTNSVAELEAELDAMANRQFTSPEFRDLLELPLTMARARVMAINMAHYVKNRRDCWGHVQGGAPLDVKRLVWEHEGEELVHDPRAGTDHYTLATREARVLGLTPEEIAETEPLPGAQAAFWAWLHVATTRPWLEAFTASTMLEKRNSAVIIGGGLSSRIRQKMIEELGLPQEKLINQSVHVEADVEHASLFRTVADRYVRTPADHEAVRRAAHDSLVIDRAFRGAMAQAMARLN
jgi:hypothetical protein